MINRLSLTVGLIIIFAILISVIFFYGDKMNDEYNSKYYKIEFGNMKFYTTKVDTIGTQIVFIDRDTGDEILINDSYIITKPKK